MDFSCFALITACSCRYSLSSCHSYLGFLSKLSPTMEEQQVQNLVPEVV